ncbi:MAG: hypothetical protein R6X22_01795 [Gemmatimonadota bacterium]|jgi:hypothetical protein
MTPPVEAPPAARHPPAARSVPALAAALTLLAAPATGSAQYRIVSPGADTLAFSSTEVRAMLDTTRALRADLERDPRVLYRLGFVDRVSEETPEPAFPWNAVEPESDSTVVVATPGNLREAGRAYENYAVLRMHVIRERDPDAPCDSIVTWEAEAVSAFADGWIVARTLFGGPPFAPLDEIAFARAGGHLEALIADRQDRWAGACAGEWATAHPGAVEAYRTWRETGFLDASPEAAAAEPAEGEEG